MRFWIELALHVLLPRACVHCREDLPFQDAGPLCGDCRSAIPPAPDPACVRCGGFLGARRDFCGACAGRLFACRIIRTAAAHRGPAASLVHAAKFRGFPSAARAAGRRMAQDFSRHPALARFDALVSVPLYPRRERQRGFNQAKILTSTLGSAIGKPVLDALERRRAAPPSWRLDRRARQAELSGAFVVRPSLSGEVAGQRLLLIDDVCSTGTTLEECAWALRGAGARDVAGYAFTRAGRPAAI